MAEIKFSQLTTAAQLTNDDIFAFAQMQGGSLSSVKTSMIAVANFLNTQVQYTNAYGTQAKTTAGAINELKQLISLIPQFAIEVVEELPTEDISDTTIYLVPAEDPEVGNYYEEYIHVNDSWELVGTTAVDLSAYYTKLEVDGLLATKASVAEVALKENKSDMPTDVRTIIKDCKTPKSATITNGIAQFECIEENLVKALKITMNPIQDLHGYSNPWVGGAGKNKLDLANATLSKPSWYSLTWNDPTLTSDGNGIIQTKAFVDGGAGGFVIDALPSGDYTLSLTADRQNSFVYCGIYYTTNGSDYNEIKTHATVMTQIETSNRYYLNFTVPSTATQLAFRPTIREHSTPYTIGDIQIESGNQATDFVPYSNICPISGRTEASVTRTAGEDVETKTHQYSETIYGGVDDFVNGGLSNEWGYIASYDGETLPGEWISDRDVYAPDTTPTTGAQVAYKLATPTTISTSAEEITTVAGTNIISGTEPISECKYTELATVDDLIKIIGGQ